MDDKTLFSMIDERNANGIHDINKLCEPAFLKSGKPGMESSCCFPKENAWAAIPFLQYWPMMSSMQIVRQAGDGSKFFAVARELRASDAS